MRFVITQFNKNIHFPNRSFFLQANSISYRGTTNSLKAALHIQTDKLLPQASSQKKKETRESNQAVNESKAWNSKLDRCPKNLDYFNKKPRPKETPEECFTCKNLIECVCVTNN
jgi:hypothetical protein